MIIAWIVLTILAVGISHYWGFARGYKDGINEHHNAAISIFGRKEAFRIFDQHLEDRKKAERK